MNTVKEITQTAAKATNAIEDLAKFIYQNDPSYARNLEQMHRAFEIINNLERYALAIQERKQ